MAMERIASVRSAGEPGAAGRAQALGRYSEKPQSASRGRPPASRKCDACGKQYACRCAQKSMQMAKKSAEMLAHQLLCWRCTFCNGPVEGFEDEPITILPLGHNGSKASEELERHLSRWLARLMMEDQCFDCIIWEKYELSRDAKGTRKPLKSGGGARIVR
ncbi:unnamed protein product, partial [Durusdinium trenchii]